MRVVKGGRYMLAFGGKWEPGKEYEALTMVESYGFSYISRKPVPKDIDISNREYWYRVSSTIAQIEKLQEMLEQGTTGAGTLYSDQYDIKESNEDNSEQLAKLFNDAILQGKQVFISKGYYVCKKEIGIKFDKDNNNKRELLIDGNLSTLCFDNCHGIRLIIDNDGSEQWHYFGKFVINNLNINGINCTNSTNTRGIIIGSTPRGFDTIPNYSQLNNVCITGFNNGIELVNARHIAFNNVIIRDLIGDSVSKSCITAFTGGRTEQGQNIDCFTGDLIFNDCEFVCHNVRHIFTAHAGNISSHEKWHIVAGLHFSHCILYGNHESSSALINCESKDIRFTDILIDGCQIDQHPNGALINAIGNGDSNTTEGEASNLRYQYNIINCWATNLGTIINGNYLYSVNIQGCNMLELGKVISGYYNSHININANTFTRVKGKSLINGRDILINNNIFRIDKDYTDYIIDLDGVADFIMTNNLMLSHDINKSSFNTVKKTLVGGKYYVDNNIGNNAITTFQTSI